MKIGMFDSGVGGLSVLHLALRMLGTPEYLYYADTTHAPYGTKDTDQITAYARSVTAFLRDKGAEAIVIACNTATSAAVMTLRQETDIPVIGMEPAVKPALQVKTDGERNRVLVLATPLTLKEHKLSELIKRYDDEGRVDLLALPELVTFAERHVFAGAALEDYLKDAFAQTDPSRYAAVVTGCTHFVFFLPQLKTFFPEKTVFTDGGEGTVRQTAHVCGLQVLPEMLAEESAYDLRRVTYYMSGKEVTDDDTIAQLFAYHARLSAIQR